MRLLSVVRVCLSTKRLFYTQRAKHDLDHLSNRRPLTACVIIPQFVRPSGCQPTEHYQLARSPSSLERAERVYLSGTHAWIDSGLPPPGKETGIGRDSASPIAAIGVLSLGLLLPVGAGPLTDRAVAMLTSSVEGQTKTITLVRNGQAEPVRTRAATVNQFFVEQNIERTPEDALDVDPSSALSDGEMIAYRAAVPVTVVIDGVSRTLRTSAD